MFESDSAPRHEGPIRALVVEDEPEAAALVTRRLDWSPAADFAVSLETTLGGAFERLEEEPYDVVILDIGLPDSNGLSTLANASILAHQLPVVVLSGNTDESLAYAAVQCGVHDFLLKDQQDGRTLVSTILGAVRTHAVFA